MANLFAVIVFFLGLPAMDAYADYRIENEKPWSFWVYIHMVLIGVLFFVMGAGIYLLQYI